MRRVRHEGDGLQKVTSQIQTVGTESDSFLSIYYTFLTCQKLSFVGVLSVAVRSEST